MRSYTFIIILPFVSVFLIYFFLHYVYLHIWLSIACYYSFDFYISTSIFLFCANSLHLAHTQISNLFILKVLPPLSFGKIYLLRNIQIIEDL